MGQHRRRHQDKDIENLLQQAEKANFRVISKPKGYFKILCNCEERRYRSVALTPSGSRYSNNLAAWIKRCECGKGVIE